MFGIVDSLSILINSDSERFNNTFVRHVIKQPGSLTWVCFLPWRTKIKDAKKLGFIPEKGDVIAYEMPDDILSDNPQLTLNLVNEIGKDLENIYNKLKLSTKQIAFLGISVGTLPAFFFANKYPAKRIIAVCPTDRLGDGIFTTLAAKNIKKEALKKGYTAKKYDSIISHINPENNISKLPKEITIYLSRFDKFVPYNGGLRLIKKIHKNHKKVTVKIFHFFGHMPVLYFFGKKKNKFNLN